MNWCTHQKHRKTVRGRAWASVRVTVCTIYHAMRIILYGRGVNYYLFDFFFFIFFCIIRFCRFAKSFLRAYVLGAAMDNGRFDKGPSWAADRISIRSGASFRGPHRECEQRTGTKTSKCNIIDREYNHNNCSPDDRKERVKWCDTTSLGKDFPRQRFKGRGAVRGKRWKRNRVQTRILQCFFAFENRNRLHPPVPLRPRYIFYYVSEHSQYIRGYLPLRLAKASFTGPIVSLANTAVAQPLFDSDTRSTRFRFTRWKQTRLYKYYHTRTARFTTDVVLLL